MVRKSRGPDHIREHVEKRGYNSKMEAYDAVNEVLKIL